MQNSSDLYEKDFYAWTQKQVELIQQKALNKLDLVHLQDEIESMGVREKNELKSRLVVLIMHLLKWKYQPEYQSKSWDLTIWHQRQDIKALLEDNPSLKNEKIILTTLEKAYNRAVAGALKETGFLKNPFPKTLPYTLNQLLDDSFLPD